ncbi:glycosyltransferase family 4 protein [Haloferax sp. DFSO52]|uniref:glycosyltransferase family 4 protein n=1 Tax=Haloferax sp. DFSO52 TaxID=3388505 RepID=UPI003A8B27DD
MRIGLVYSTGFPPEEGIGTYVWKLANNLRKRGHTPVLITRGNGKSSIKNGIEIHQAKFYPVYPFHVHVHEFFVQNVVDKLDLDVLHIHSPLSPVVDADVPILATIHTPIMPVASITDKTTVSGLLGYLQSVTVSQRIERDLVNSADMVTAVSESIAEALELQYSENTRLLYNGVDADEYDECTEQGEDKYLLFVGRIAQSKGILQLIRAYSEYNIDLPVRVVGSGPLEGKMKQFVSKKDISDKVIIKGYVSDGDLKEMYANAEALILPSLYEGLPTVVLEALASGTPVIGTEVPGIQDLINHRVNGLLMPDNSIEQIHASITKLSENPELKSLLSSNARQSVVPKYTWDSISNDAIKYYNTLTQ